MAEETPRNAPCPCGSGKKYKQCHLGIEAVAEKQKKSLIFGVVIAVALALGVLVWQTTDNLGTGGAVALGVAVLGAMVVVFRDPPPPNTGGDDPAAMNFGR
ncbi:MAG: hypothetical protein ACI9MR_001736 [Myxococcota bacterium]|jgi:hypothetical protein